MLTITNRWQKVLKDLSFVDASFTDERAKISAEIETLAKAPLADHETLICIEFEETAKRLRLAVAATKHDPETKSFVFDVAQYCQQLGKQLLIFDENSSRALIALFLDTMPPIEHINDDTFETDWVNLLWGVSAVLYQTGPFIFGSVAETKRLTTLFKLLDGEIKSPLIRRLLTQSCVNMVLPTRDGTDQDFDMTKTSLQILLNVIKRDHDADKCIDSAQTILIAIKGLSRIIERGSSTRAGFIDPHNQLNDIFEQMIDWSLFQLNGAQTVKKAIVRETVPVEFIPDDELIREANPNELPKKKKRPVTRRRFHPTAENGEVLNLEGLSESLPWLDVSSSDSDTDKSDSEKSELEKEQSQQRKLNMKWGCIRQAALLTLKITIKYTTKRDLCHYWKLFLPPSSDSDELTNSGLLIAILFDPAPRARNIAVDVLRHFVQQSRQFLTKVGETRRQMTSNTYSVTSAFRTLAEGVTLSIERTHKLLVFALERESRTRHPSNQEQLLISQLYATLRATVEASIYLNDDLLTWCVARLLKIERSAGQFQFFKSLANAKMATGSVLFESQLALFDKGDSTEGPWPLVIACNYIKWSLKQEQRNEFNDRIRVLPEEDALELIQSLVTHHLGLMANNYAVVFESIDSVLNSHVHPNITAAAFRLLLSVNQQCKLWRQKNTTTPPPVPLEPHTRLWSRLIKCTLNRYVSMKNPPVPIAHALLDALSHIEPDVFDQLERDHQVWMMSSIPSLCGDDTAPISDRRDELIETRALHALGDLVLIRGLRRDADFVGNVANVILRKCRQKEKKIFAEKKVSEQEHTLRGKLRNDLIYAVACLGDALRMSQAELPTAADKGAFVHEIFPSSEIKCYYALMAMIRDFYRFIGSQDRSKPQAIRAIGGFLFVAPPETPRTIITTLVTTLEEALKGKNAKLVWNGAKSCEYFFMNKSTLWLEPAWSDRLFRALSVAMHNNKNNKVKINCLSALALGHVREEIMFRQPHLVQIFHDCVAVAADVNRLETKFAEIDYHAKLRDMCCETIIAFSHEKNSTLAQIVANQRQTLLPVFVEYVEVHDNAIQIMETCPPLKPLYEDVLKSRPLFVDINQNDEAAIFRSAPKILPDEDFA